MMDDERSCNQLPTRAAKVTASWQDLPADLLDKVAKSLKPSLIHKMRQVCLGWKRGLDAVSTALRLGDSPLPQRLTERFPSLATLHSISKATQGRFKYLRGIPLTDLTMHIYMNDITTANVDLLKHLPLTRLDLSGLDLSRTNPERVLTAPRLRALQGLPLVSLVLSGFDGTRLRPISFSDAGLAALRGTPLTKLTLNVTAPLTDAGLDALRGMPLTKLTLLGAPGKCKISGAGLRALEGAPITELSLGRGLEVNEVGLAALRGLPLRILVAISCTDLTDAGLSALAEMSGLITLRLLGCRKLPGAGFAQLPKQALRTITCDGVTDAGMAEIANFWQLERLDLSGSGGITDAGLAEFTEDTDEFGEPPSCSQLILRDCSAITDAGLGALKFCPDLTHLDITNCGQISDAGLMELVDLPLSSLEVVRCTGLTPQGVCKFWQARLQHALETRNSFW